MEFSSENNLELDVVNTITVMINHLHNHNITEAASLVREDVTFVRPTGNPLNKEQWVGMFSSDDVTLISNKLLKVHRVNVSGNMAMVCYTTHAKFNYKGTENDDVSVFSAVLVRNEDVNRWEVLHVQRSTGRSPDDDMPNFGN
jgi:ketosteroid isomerase-like protein